MTELLAVIGAVGSVIFVAEGMIKIFAFFGISNARDLKKSFRKMSKKLKKVKKSFKSSR